MFKRFTIIFVILSVLSCMLLCACDSDNFDESSASEASAEKSYKVLLKDALGNPVTTGVIVHFVKNGETVAMQPVNDQGEAVKTLTADNYTAKIAFTDQNASVHFDGETELSPDKTETELIISQEIVSEPIALFVNGSNYDAYEVQEGCTYVKLSRGDRNYYLFTPKTAGLYEFAVYGNEKATIGHYGAPHYVQENNVGTISDENKLQISVSATMIGKGDGGTSTYVIGIDLLEDADNKAVLTIERIGDPKRTIEDEPWTIYQTTEELKEYSLPVGATLGEFDLTASTDAYNIVLNENDGYYHLNDANGPLVLVRVAEDCEYIACFATMLDRSGVSKYFFDDDGNFVKKESYSECLLEYIKYVDENEGVYPLTEDLKYIIQQRGEYAGWWDPEKSSYLFKDLDGNNLSDINNEIAWLLMCCYIEGGK